ncbi:MAG: hypothetical protein C4289_15015 [Chloroflexota bacterium]
MSLRPRVRLRAEDIWQAPEDGRIYEVIDGELYVAPSPGTGHQREVGKLFLSIGSYLQEHPLGEVFMAPLGVVLDKEDGVQPDLVYVPHEHAHIITDRGIKQRRYARAGVPHYWIVDPGQRTLEVDRLAERYAPGSSFRPALFLGLEISPDVLWR